jgi:hypothetical protein
MLSIIIDVLVAIALYLVPGYLLLLWVDLPSLRGINRWIVALCLSLVIVPYSLITVGNLVHIQASLWAWAILVIILAVGAFWLKRANQLHKVRFVLNPGSDEVASITSRRIERVSIIVFIVLFSALVNLPRVLMFFQGSNVMELGPYDENWHIQQLVAVARTGIPPYHYFYPPIHLGYYYGSWIYPAIIGNLPGLSVSLMRALAMHAYIQIFAFLGLVYVILQLNIRRPLVRMAGMAFFTVMGGFDLFAKLPGIESIEFWIRDSSWLANGFMRMQISQFATLYMWVPHHLAGGMVVLLLVLLYKNLDVSWWVKLGLTGMLLGFCLTTSPFVFIGIAISAGIIFLWQLPSLWRNRKSILPKIALALVLFIIVSWLPLRMYSAHNSSLTYNNFEINLVERFRGASSLTTVIDKSLTLLGLPLVAGALLIVDMGLMFILYVVWWIRRLTSHEAIFGSEQNALLGLQPIISIIFVFMVTDRGGGSNVTMRGMICGQILITLAAILALDWIADVIEGAGSKRYILAYIFVCFLIAQSVSPLAELRATAKRSIQIALWKECGVPAILTNSFDNDYCLIDDAWRYVYWLNNNTPRDALILEDGPFEQDYIKFRWLERNRLLVPDESNMMGLNYFDMDFILPQEWAQMVKQGSSNLDALGWYKALEFPGKNQHPVYLVIRQDEKLPAGAADLVYQDKFVKIFHLSEQLLYP